MNLENIKEGMIITNYKELCKLLGMNVKSGKSKQLHLKEFERHVKYHKNGNSFVIDEIYTKPLPKTDKRGGNNAKYKDLTRYIPELCNYIVNTHGHDITQLCVNSKIELEWLCPRCKETHVKRIDRVCLQQHTLCSNCCLSKNARKINTLLTDTNVKFDREVKFSDLKSPKDVHLRFDFGIYNNDTLIGLIEYDGEFHDNHDLIQEYDEIKNEYCESNHIPLLRIHYTEADILSLKLHNFLKEIHCNGNLSVIKNDIINSYTEKIQYHENQIKQLQDEMNNMLTMLQ